VISQCVSKRQYAKWTKIVQFRPSRSTIIIFSPTLTQNRLNRFSPLSTRCRAITGAINECICKTIVHFVSETRAKNADVNFDVCKNRQKLIGYHSNVPWTTGNLCQYYNPHIYIYKCWSIGKDWFSSCWDIRQYRPILADLQDNFHFLPQFNSKTTEPIIIIFSHDIEQLVELLMRICARRYPIPFRNDRAISAGVGNCAPFLPLNWLPWQRLLRYWKKIQIYHLHPKPFHTV